MLIMQLHPSHCLCVAIFQVLDGEKKDLKFHVEALGQKLFVYYSLRVGD